VPPTPTPVPPTSTPTPTAAAVTADLTILKRASGTGTPLAGAIFTLAGGTPRTTRTATTGSDGRATFTGLILGTYTLTETQAPYGYVAITTARTIRVDAAGNVTSDGVDLTNAPLTIDNEPVASTGFNVLKLSGAGSPLAGAGFLLTGGSPLITVTRTTDENGIATFDGLRPGSYRLTETVAPNGYALAVASWMIVVDGAGAISGTGMISGRITITNSDSPASVLTMGPNRAMSMFPPGESFLLLDDSMIPLSAGMPGTGDMRNRALAVSLLAASSLGLALYLYISMRKKKSARKDTR